MSAPRPASPTSPAEPNDAESGREVPALEGALTPEPRAHVVLSSGRRYELEAGSETDKVTIRGRGGEVVLRIEVGEHGPVLSFSGASVELAASKQLRLSAEQITVSATRDLELQAGGDLREVVAGDHHTRVAGAERLEAAAVEVQASEQSLKLKAMHGIALDAEHIGLNDDPAPAPFPWSALKPDE